MTTSALICTSVLCVLLITNRAPLAQTRDMSCPANTVAIQPGASIQAAVDRTPELFVGPEGQDVYYGLAMAAAGPCALADREVALQSALARLDDPQPAGRAVALAAVYRAVCQSGASAEVACSRSMALR